MPAKTKPGEIWLIDLGMAAKVRPGLLLSDYPADDELALLIVVPHTTSVRGNRWEFTAALPFLTAGAFHLQQIQPVSLGRLERRLGVLPSSSLKELRGTISRLLRLEE
jgi:mRNA interferase MazF